MQLSEKFEDYESYDQKNISNTEKKRLSIHQTRYVC